MAMILASLAIFALTASVSSADLTCADKLQDVTAFKPSMFATGIWYEYKVKNTIYTNSTNYKCGMSRYVTDPNENYDVYREEIGTSGNNPRIIHTHACRLQGDTYVVRDSVTHFPIFNGTIVVMDTDYTGYAILVMCNQLTLQMDPTVYGFVRDPSSSPHKSNADAALKNNKVSDGLTTTDQSCPKTAC